MKVKKAALVLVFVLLWTVSARCADSEARPYIGVMLDSRPLPDLLVKHLGLSAGQGVRIANLHKDGPADKAGLERDDIIIGLQGEDVDDYEAFINDVRKAGIGTEISLEIIHLGTRKTVMLKLEALKGDFDLKYPPEPEIMQSWRPGKMFQLRPGDDDWTEIFREGMPPDFDVNIKKFFKELYTYKHSDGEDYTITIEGSPDDQDSVIIVRIGDTEYKTTLKSIDKLPEKYRAPAEQALKDARDASKRRRSDAITVQPPRRTPYNWRSYFDKVNPYRNAPAPPLGPDNQMLDKIQKQMHELQKRLEELEKRQKETTDSKNVEKQKSIQSEEKDEQRI